MNEDALRSLLQEVSSGELHPDDAVRELRSLPFADLGFARIDHHRELRQGRAETIYGPGKSPTQVVAIVDELLGEGAGSPVLLSRADAAQTAAAVAAHPDGVVYGDPSRAIGATVVWRAAAPRDLVDPVVVATAGTADLPIADECSTVLSAHGVEPVRLTDVGVAGVHRLLGSVPLLQSARVVVVVAGMEGALASLIGGLTGAPVVAVPTSVGYGSGLQGVTALLSMTASCASGITVVGIDNGFGAACAVLRLLASDPQTAAPAAAPPLENHP